MYIISANSNTCNVLLLPATLPQDKRRYLRYTEVDFEFLAHKGNALHRLGDIWSKPPYLIKFHPNRFRVGIWTHKTANFTKFWNISASQKTNACTILTKFSGFVRTSKLGFVFFHLIGFAQRYGSLTTGCVSPKIFSAPSGETVLGSEKVREVQE